MKAQETTPTQRALLQCRSFLTHDTFFQAHLYSPLTFSHTSISIPSQFLIAIVWRIFLGRANRDDEMANVQIVRQQQVQRNPLTTTKVDQAQSLQLVQTMLHGALSMLTFSRGLFPEKAFATRFYDSQDITNSYESFASGRMPSTKAEAKGPSTKVPVLMRQRSRRADRLLDWLERGIFHEIESGKLRAVQIFIHPHHELRDQVIEAYTFTVHYTTAGDGKRIPSGLTTGASGQEIATSEATRVALQQLLRNLSDLCDDLPILPGKSKRMLSMGLVYEGGSSRDRLVEGFGPDEGGDLSFPAIQGWRIGTESYQLASGYHSSHLKITGMQPDPEQLGSNHIHQLPNDLQFALDTSRYTDVLAMPPPTLNQSRPQSNTNKVRESSTPDARPQHYRHLRDSSTDGPEKSNVKPMDYVNGSGRTKSSLTDRMNSDLGRMMQPEQITQGDTQPQGNFFASTSTFGDDDAPTATPTTIHASPVKATGTRLQSDQSAFKLKTNKKKEILKRKTDLTKTTREFAERAGGVTQTGQIVLCPCGGTGEEGDMVQCSGCDAWQHLHCYGYVGENDPRLPEEHFCHCCVVDETDTTTLKAIQELASQRRALFFVCQIGMRSKADMSKMLGCDKQMGADLHKMIVDGKYVEAAVNSHKSGYRITGKALWVPVQDRIKLREMLEIYFNPMTAVSKHYDLQPNESKIAQKAAEINVNTLLIMRTELPEPVHRRFKSVERAPTPSSEPVPSDTYGPLARPTLATTPAPQALKRKAAADDVGDVRMGSKKSATTPSTKQQMFSGLKSLMVIDAGGDSSPLSWHGSARKSRR
ncbi:hypothetical protein Q7P37_007780 [Cladosporium fusiforme]